VRGTLDPDTREALAITWPGLAQDHLAHHRTGANRPVLANSAPNQRHWPHRAA
jgi:hypothetical protein